MSRRRVALPPMTQPQAASAGVVDVITGGAPVVPPVPQGPLSEHDARALTARIREAAREIGDRLGRLCVLVEQARTGEAWVALGYASWTAYLAETLEPMRLPRTERREVVGYLTGQGMSSRAIAPIVSSDPKTVTNDRRALAASREDQPGGEVSPPAAVVITGRDGRSYSPRDGAATPAPAPAAPRRAAAPPRSRAAAALHAVRAEPRPCEGDVSAFATGRAAQILERAAGHAARESAVTLLSGDVRQAKEWATAYVVLAERADACSATTGARSTTLTAR